MKQLLRRHSKAFGFGGAVVALIIATIYIFIVPEEAAATEGVLKFVLKYGHSLCWLLLSVASLMWTIKPKNKWSKRLAYAALVAYLTFISTFLIVKFL